MSTNPRSPYGDRDTLGTMRGESVAATYREGAVWLGLGAMWWVGLAIVSAVVLLGYTFLVRPAQLAGERIGNQQSQQYEATQIAGMRTNFDTVQAMDREVASLQSQPQTADRDRLLQADMASRQAALNDIKRNRDLMPDQSKIPPDIAAYLSRSGN